LERKSVKKIKNLRFVGKNREGKWQKWRGKGQKNYGNGCLAASLKIQDNLKQNRSETSNQSCQ